ncbi:MULTISPECIES: PH domain-containing protein [unclassified Streptomyces]|uniref:PH domain-containing protein n=1 Tax=unclassified Streptomyces TaxID=2593676 RepID=UPI0013DED7AB|nr:MULTISPECIES: PH domain-containing protein [unclassified Streptomyces]
MAPRADRRVIHKYSLRPRQLVLITLFLGLSGIPLAHPVLAEDDVPVALKAAVLVPVGLVYLAIVAFWRAATLVHQDHIAVRQLFRTRRIEWSDVLSIEADAQPGSSRVLLLDREGRLFALLGGVEAHGDEVRTVKGLWEQFRGESWAAPSAAFVARAQRRARARRSARVVWGCLVAVGLVLVLVGSGIALDA